MSSDCVCGDLFCDGYNSACWDRETKRLRAEGNRRVDERYRLEQAVIDAARAWKKTYMPAGPDDGAFEEDLALFDAVRALDAEEGER